MTYFTYLHRLSILFLASILLLVSACDHPEPNKKPKPVVIVEQPELINKAVAVLLAESLSSKPQSLVIEDDSLFSAPFIYQFYKSRQFITTWTNKGKLTFQGDSLMQLLQQAPMNGLISKDYHLEKIGNLLKPEKNSHKHDANKLSEAELLLTDAFFTYAVHIHAGRLNKDSLTREWHPQYADTNLVQLLTTALRHNTIQRTLHAMEPQMKQYQLLKIALRTFLAEFKDITWDSLRSRSSDSATFNTRLKDRLIASHDFSRGDVDSLVSDSILLIKAIKNFQCKNNLIEDGKLGKLTFKALQRTKEDYIKQLELNMERCRWHSLPTETRYVWVNIPKYEMRVWEDDSLILKSRVIVGAPLHPTPIVRSRITNFLIYPYWNVPYSIATKEILPILKRDTSYIRKNNFVVLNSYNQPVNPFYINWKKYDEDFFPWRLRQATGIDNSLGVLKFNFQNKFGVYMHDTDHRNLFGREMRALSHGCVRLDKFVDFAKYLIREDSVKYPVDSLMYDLTYEKQKYVYIRKPIPIYITYYTAEVNDLGELFFFYDVYGLDEKMKKALY
ncbi:MAG TPA: L,D-transpeptidase family protein [Bacteroidia bacterium]|jgi:murein L,D-transpeptidase YcbB/YkuD|nr:L,D-transpeptidase family protein [Bacteroidia bacterium]